MASTLFAFCVTSGDDDDLLDILDHVADAGISDSDWDWLTWVDVRDRIFVVVRGSLAARGAFMSCDDLMRPIRLSVAARKAEDNRSEWDEPRNGAEGRERLEEWLKDPGIAVLDRETIETALPKPSTPTPVSPLILKGRERLEQSMIPITESKPSRSPSKSGSGRDGHRNKGRFDRQQGSKKSEGNSVLEAFSAAMASKTDSQGRKFSLYRPAAVDDP